MDNWNENNFDQNNNQNPYQQPAGSYEQSAKPKHSGGNGFGTKLAKCVAIVMHLESTSHLTAQINLPEVPKTPAAQAAVHQIRQRHLLQQVPEMQPM